LTVALLFVEKIRQSDAQFWFGLRIVGFIQIFYSRAVIQRAIVVLSRIFGARFGGKDCGLCKWVQPVIPTRRMIRLEAFLYEVAQNFEVFSNIQDQN
jgi:hypothetical protein